MVVNSNFKTTSYKIFYILVSSLILIIPAFYNRFPFFYSDSALYIGSSITLIPTTDRPIGYALFIRGVSWQSSLWLVIYFQALITNLVIYFILNKVNKKWNLNFLHISVLIVFSVFCSLGWYVSQLMPDIFTSLLLLSVYIYFSEKRKFSFGILLLLLLMMLGLVVHLSNFPIFILCLATVLGLVLFSKRYREKRKHYLIKMIAPILVVIISANILMIYNYTYFNKYKLSTTSNVFFLARLIDTGVIEEYLEDNCGNYNFTLCQYKNEIPRSSQLFIWGQDGPYYKTGSWSTPHEDYNIMIRDILTTPKYLKVVLFDFAVSPFKQLINFRIGEGIDCAFDENSAPIQYVLSKFPRSEIKRDLLLSEQNTGKMDFREINILHYLIILASLLTIIYVLFKKKLSDNIFMLTWVILSGLFYNAAICADLSNVLNRYQSRVIWLLPLLAIILAIETLNFKFKNDDDK
jgi:hypothetical protein